jgi:hypothetical protein
MPRTDHVSSAVPLAELELVPTKLHMPRPVEMRLEEMVSDLMKRARDLGDVNRGELVGSLLLASAVDETLAEAVRGYRRATVADALPGRRKITLPPRQRGRPSRRG